MYHSFSSWQLFLACPHAWHARYVSKTEVKRPDSPALIKGREMHKFMEETVKNGTLSENEHKIAPVIYSELSRIGRENQTVKTEIDIYCNYNGDIIKKDWINPAGVVLKIDLLAVANTGITMIDYKTGASKGKEEQLCLYSYPFGGNTTCEFMYLDQNEIDKFYLDSVKVKQTWDNFMQYVDFVEAKRDKAGLFEKRENMGCRWCCVQGCPMARGLK